MSVSPTARPDLQCEYAYPALLSTGRDDTDTLMMSDSPFDPWMDDVPDTAGAGVEEHVQCPNCCRLAAVVDRRMGLLFYECELCGTTGATGRDDAGEKRQREGSRPDAAGRGEGQRLARGADRKRSAARPGMKR
jgi:hypothetical protein